MTEASYCVSKEAQRYLFQAGLLCCCAFMGAAGGGFWWCRVCYPMRWVWGLSGQGFVQAAQGGVALSFGEYISVSVTLC